MSDRPTYRPSPIQRKAELEAAWPDVKHLCESKRRGDTLSREEVATVATGVDPARFDDRIRRYFRNAAGVHLVSLPGVGWRLPLDEEQATDKVRSLGKVAQTYTTQRYHAALSTNEERLSPHARRYRQETIRHVGTLMAAEQSFRTETKPILGGPAARPQLVDGKPKE